MKFLQKLGKALMLPVAVLPICGILMGIGYWLCPATMPTSPAAVSGRSSPWCWAAPRISGSMSRAFTAGKRKANTSGTPGAKSPPFGSSTSPRKTATIPP